MRNGIWGDGQFAPRSAGWPLAWRLEVAPWAHYGQECGQWGVGSAGLATGSLVRLTAGWSGWPLVSGLWSLVTPHRCRTVLPSAAAPMAVASGAGMRAVGWVGAFFFSGRKKTHEPPAAYWFCSGVGRCVVAASLT
jgi:hypothetical protein